MTHEKDMSFVQGGNCELGAICQNRTIFHYKVPFLMEMKVIFLIPVPPKSFLLKSIDKDEYLSILRFVFGKRQNIASHPIDQH